MGAESDEGDDEPPASFRFVVTTTKAGKTLVLNCMSTEGRATIVEIAVSNQDIEKIRTNPEINSEDYQGPEFHELDEELQKALDAYLEDELGINEDIAAFICMYADYREQSQYVQFLEDVKSIV